MNVIYKGKRVGTINEIRKLLSTKRPDLSRTYELGRTPREVISKLMIVCGRVGNESLGLYRAKAGELESDFIAVDSNSWTDLLASIKRAFDPGRHTAILLIGSRDELPSTPMRFGGNQSFTDWFLQDVDGDGVPDVPVGRIFGLPQTVLYHMDPLIIDSNIAVIFDSQPGRSNRHVQALVKLGFDVQVLEKFAPGDVRLMSLTEFILQFSDGVYSSRIHGTPDMWASHNSMILSHQQVSQIGFQGYPFVFSEACCTAGEGPLVRAFLNQGACYLGASLDTMNNTRSFDDWRYCAYCDGYKYGILDLLDSYETLGQVKLQVDREIFNHLDESPRHQIEDIKNHQSQDLSSENALSAIEWVMLGNPVRRTTVGPNADYNPGKITVDT
ncbi:MAG: hypothetical protein C4K47_09870 [Candidatus Thorarchaeota archaeon]|nr:MAG: hypothetical protein C4K47_09870 [Candidatus Thorarchaeota archaeon]